MRKRIILDLPTFKDERGSLTVLQDALPFHVNRTYWIYGADGQKRGGHRHKKNRQALISLSGEVILYINNGLEEMSFYLNNPSTCIIIEPEDWHTMTFTKSSILIVFASHNYDKDDYIDTQYIN